MQKSAADGGLAAAGFADKAEGLALVDGEGNTVDGLEGLGLEKTGVDIEIFLEVLYLYKGLLVHFAHCSSPPSSF